MSEAVLVALITGGISLLGIIITAFWQNASLSEDFKKQSEVADVKLDAKIAEYRAATDVKIDQLCEEVRTHNNFARRVPVIEEQIKVANHRIDDLEHASRA